MKKCVCCGRETYHKVGEQNVCAQCDVDGSFEYHLKRNAAQPRVQLTGGILPDLQALSTPQHLSGLKADSTPPTSN